MTIISHTFDITHVVGSGRNSQLPDGHPALAGTVLQQIADELAPGRAVLLNPVYPSQFEGSWILFRRYRPDGEYLSADDATWAAKSLWDRTHKTSWTVAERAGGTRPPSWNLRAYRASDNNFFHGSFALNPDMSHAHTYGGQAIDDARGYIYYRCTPNLIRRYNVNSSTWEQINITANGIGIGGTGGQTYHEGLDGLLVISSLNSVLGVAIWRNGDSEWTWLAETGHHAHHAHMTYNRVRGDALILGGNSNPEKVTLINADGSITAMQDRPDTVDGYALRFGMQSRHLSYDPISGNYLMLDRDSKRVMWEYSPDLDEWRVGKDWASGQSHSDDWPGPYYGHPIVPVDELGVILWLSSYVPRVYKHVSVF